MSSPTSIFNRLHTIFKLAKEPFSKYFNLWIWLYVFGLCGSIDYIDIIYLDYSILLKIVYLASIAGLKATVLYSLYLFCRPYRIAKILSVTAISVFIVLSLINILSYKLYGFGISQKFFNLIYQTNALEIKEFLSDFLNRLINISKNLCLFLIIFCMVLSLALSKYLSYKIKIFIVSFTAITGVIASIFIYANFPYLFRIQFITYRTYVYSKLSYSNYKEFEESLKAQNILPDADSIESRYLANTTVVVIGESASREHLSLYGYTLPTTPVLDSLKNHLYIFQNAISCSTTTYKSLAHIMSFLPDSVSETEISNFPLLIDTFKEAGYKTYWLSNQSKTGLMSQHTYLITSHADVSEYISTDDSDEFFLYRHDEKLLPYIEDAAKDENNKIIFVHLMGSHQEYKHRFPKESVYFTSSDELKYNNRDWLDDRKAQIIADYDNSIRYTDSILGKIIRLVENQTKPALFLYLSDHGEIVYDFEDNNGRTDQVVSVPFLIYPNKAYKVHNKDLISKLEKNSNTPFSTSNTIHTLLQLTGTSYSWYNEKLDILSDSFAIRNRYVDGKVWRFDNLQIKKKDKKP